MFDSEISFDRKMLGIRATLLKVCRRMKIDRERMTFGNIVTPGPGAVGAARLIYAEIHLTGATVDEIRKVVTQTWDNGFRVRMMTEPQEHDLLSFGTVG